ncbi:hypothetical protein T06_2214 [Trichinella sp. T6]|nr:hypothetical protein T06_2214 [Trichinella sp. T6]
MAVTSPFDVKAILKSISPKKLYIRSPCLLIKPIATPETELFVGTPASISAKEPAQTDAIDELPLLSSTSAARRMVNGKSDGTTGRKAFSANAPWPNSRRPMPRADDSSLVANDAKL